MMPTAVFMLVGLIALGLPGWFLASSVKLVPPARSMPSLGVVCPEANIPPVSAAMAIRIRARTWPGLPWPPGDLRPFFGAATLSFLPVQPSGVGCSPDGHEVLWGPAPPAGA